MKRLSAFTILLTAIFTLCAWGGALADELQGRAGTLSISPMVGGCWFEGDQQLKVSPAFGFALGYNADEHLGMELGFSYIGAETRHVDVDVHTFFYHVDGVYHFTRRGIVQPYVAMGIGGMTFDYEGKIHGKDPSDTAFAFNHGGGLEIFVMDNLAVRADVRHIITFNGGFNDLLFTGGITYFIPVRKTEAKAEAAPPPPPPPAPEVKEEAPAPPPKQEEVCIDLKVLFDFDKDVVKPKYHDDIKRVADFLQANPTFHGTIEGGTDAVGSEDYNQALSMRRAESVKKYLVDNFGIDASRLRTVGYGKLRPVETNLTAEGREQNRRAVRVYCSAGEDLPLLPKPRKCVVLKVVFALNSADFDPDKYADALKEVANYMKAHPDYVGTIEGYADASGSGLYNMNLSQKRADNVKKVLVKKFGVPANRLRAEAYGKERPINSNETPKGRAANRYAVQVVCEPE